MTRYIASSSSRRGKPRSMSTAPAPAIRQQNRPHPTGLPVPPPYLRTRVPAAAAACRPALCSEEPTGSSGAGPLQASTNLCCCRRVRLLLPGRTAAWGTRPWQGVEPPWMRRQVRENRRRWDRLCHSKCELLANLLHQHAINHVGAGLTPFQRPLLPKSGSAGDHKEAVMQRDLPVAPLC
jgi:hypothetical protein